MLTLQEAAVISPLLMGQSSSLPGDPQVTPYPALANAPVYVEPGPRSCGRCCGEEPRLAARTGGQGGRRKDPNTIHGEPLL